MKVEVAYRNRKKNIFFAPVKDEEVRRLASAFEAVQVISASFHLQFLIDTSEAMSYPIPRLRLCPHQFHIPKLTLRLQLLFG